MPTTSNVLQYYTEDGTKLSIRPSGTEPLVRVMIEGNDQELIEAEAKKLAALIEECIGE